MINVILRPTHWSSFIQDIEVLAVNASSLRNSKVMTPENLLQLVSDDRKDMSKDNKSSYLQEVHSAMSSSAGLSHKISGSCVWIPIDLVLEDAMDGTQVDTTSSIEIVTRNANSALVFSPKEMNHLKLQC